MCMQNKWEKDPIKDNDSNDMLKEDYSNHINSRATTDVNVVKH